MKNNILSTILNIFVAILSLNSVMYSQSIPAYNTSSSEKSSFSLNAPVVVTPFECVPNFYQVVGNNGLLVRYNTLDFTQGFDTISTFGYSLNALAYHPIDNYMYAIRTSNRNLVKIGMGGTYTDLGSIGLPNTSLFVGEFTPAGLFLVKGSGNTIYKINVNTLSFTTVTTTTAFGAADWAYNYTDNKLYGVQNNVLYAYNPATNIVTTQNLTGFINTILRIKLWADLTRLCGDFA